MLIGGVLVSLSVCVFFMRNCGYYSSGTLETDANSVVMCEETVFSVNWVLEKPKSFCSGRNN